MNSSMIWHLLFWLCFLFVVSSGQTSQKTTPKLPTKGMIHNLAKAFLSDNKITAVGISLVKYDPTDKKLIFSHAQSYGTLNPSKKLFRKSKRTAKLGPNTQFYIASITKPFTSALIGQLLAENPRQYTNQSLWNTKLTQILGRSNVNLFSSSKLNRKVTVGDCLSHRTGFPRYDLPLLYDTTHADVSKSTKIQQISQIESADPTKSFRKRFIYSNWIYAYLEKVILGLTRGRATWKQLMQRNILQPLQMVDTKFIGDADDAKWKNRFAGPNWKSKPVPREWFKLFAQCNPALGLVSSPADMRKWMQFLLSANSTKRRGTPPLNTIRSAWTPVIGVNDEIVHGMGWFAKIHEGTRMVFHEGQGITTVSSLNLFPERGIGLFVTCTTCTLDAVHSLVDTLYSTLWHGPGAGFTVDLMKERKRYALKLRLERHPSDCGRTDANAKLVHDRMFAGTYRHAFWGDIKIKRADAPSGVGTFQKFNEVLRFYLGQHGHGTLCNPRSGSDVIQMDNAGNEVAEIEYTLWLDHDSPAWALYNAVPTLNTIRFRLCDSDDPLLVCGLRYTGLDVDQNLGTKASIFWKLN